MMGTLYVIYSGERGFWSRSGQWTSKLDEAKQYTSADAVAFCRKRKGSSAMDTAISTLPVELDVAREVLGE